MNAARRPRPSREPAPRILIVLHQEHSTPGRVGRLLRAAGAELDIRRPALGDPLPDTMRDHAGAVIFGGPMSANDSFDYIRAEIDWIATPLKEEKPFLGICLGAQMLARQLGAPVWTHAQGRAEIGYYPLRAAPDACPRFAADLPGLVYQWHREGFDLPAGAALLAEAEGDFPVQAMRVGPAAYGVQFHPEVTYAMMCRWTTRAHQRLELPGARPQHEHLDGWRLHDAAVARWIDGFLRRWAGLDPPP
ncbi:MAG: glutamine amidotransferase [Methylobacteriaceae bacterium]|nr:glutamine amidotransferase [Methylobacteriaceae bacterium]